MDITPLTTGHIVLSEGAWRASVDPGDIQALRRHLGVEADAIASQHWTDEHYAWWGSINAPSAEPAPLSCSVRQGLLALEYTGRLTVVEAWLASLPDTDRRVADIEIYRAAEWLSTNALLLSVATNVLGLSEQQVFELFALARTL